MSSNEINPITNKPYYNYQREYDCYENMPPHLIDDVLWNSDGVLTEIVEEAPEPMEIEVLPRPSQIKKG